MIITRTPFRMSFFGGGTDIPEYFNSDPGAVLSTTFDKYCYVTVRHLPPFFDYRTELSYSKIERVKSIDAIEHPAIRNAMKKMDMRDIRLTYEADLPARSGLGTSSSFAVGMLNAFHALKGHYRSKLQLANEAIDLERNLCGEAGGWQDQIAASYGGLNRINFENNSFDVVPIIISPERKTQLNQNLLIFFTGFTRFSSDIQRINFTVNNGKNKEKKHILAQMYSLVDEAENILENPSRNLDDFGSLLDYTWRLKKQYGKAVSTPYIDALYQKAIEAGALGGKLLGAGGGGFLLFYVQPEKQQRVKDELRDNLFIPIQFENEGTQIIYYEPESYPIDQEKKI